MRLFKRIKARFRHKRAKKKGLYGIAFERNNYRRRGSPSHNSFYHAYGGGRLR